MRFLANENFPSSAVVALEAAGLDVVWIARAGSGSTDQDVLLRAASEARILLTFDKDFGELAKSAALASACGVILFRMPMPAPDQVGQRLAELILSRDDRTSQ